MSCEEDYTRDFRVHSREWGNLREVECFETRNKSECEEDAEMRTSHSPPKDAVAQANQKRESPKRRRGNVESQAKDNRELGTLYGDDFSQLQQDLACEEKELDETRRELGGSRIGLNEAIRALVLAHTAMKKAEELEKKIMSGKDDTETAKELRKEVADLRKVLVELTEQVHETARNTGGFVVRVKRAFSRFRDETDKSAEKMEITEADVDAFQKSLADHLSTVSGRINTFGKRIIKAYELLEQRVASLEQKNVYSKRVIRKMVYAVLRTMIADRARRNRMAGERNCPSARSLGP